MNYNHIYLILGASSDMGIALIKQLNEENNDSLFIAHYHTDAEKLKVIPMLNGNKLMSIQADLGKEEDIDLLIETIHSKADAPTHIIHIAARPFRYMKLKEFEAQSLHADIDIQVCSIARIMQAFLPIMAKRRAHNKVVVVVTSYVTEKPPRFMMGYIITKYAQLGLVRSLAADWTGKGVNINAVSPSMIQTKFLQNIDRRIVQMVADKSPDGHIATVEDVVPVIDFLLSDKANYIHGENLCVTNGGLL